MLSARRYDLPHVSAGVEDFWLAAGRGELVLRHCTACDRLHHYPRERCPWCLSADLDWQECAGTGVIDTFSIVRHPEPYALAYVRLDEGICVLTNLIGCEPEDLSIGLPVRVVFVPASVGEPAGPPVEERRRSVSKPRTPTPDLAHAVPCFTPAPAPTERNAS